MKGSCLCAGVIYEVESLASEIMHCACKTCRKAHSAAFNTAAAVEINQFKWVQGEELLRSYESSPGKLRYFCGQCGSQLIKMVEGRDQLVLRVGTLDDNPQQKPKSMIWASHAVSWLSFDEPLEFFLENHNK